jgi:integrase/recombinase XerD
MLAPIKKLGFSNRAECRGSKLIDAVYDRKSFVSLTTLVAIEMLFATGIRVGELVSLGIHDMDLQEGSIRIHGKGDRERIVFLPYPETRELIRTYLKLRAKRHPTNESLLIIPKGRAADSQYIRQLVSKAGENAGLNRRITPHMLRHTTATELLNNGVDIRFVQKLLGHQSITTTQIYTQVTDVALRRAITKGHPMRGLVNS